MRENMGNRFRLSRRTTGRSPAATPNEEEYEYPTLGLKKVTFTEGTVKHRWELPGNYPVFTVAMVIYHYVERIWRILITPILIYNIYDHLYILSG